jgi:type IV secretion system protein VirB1
MDFAAVAELCAPGVPADTLSRIASVESSFNPYAIGVVGGRLARQPKNKDEAVATANMLAANGWNYSVGIIQVNQKHFARFGLTAETAFDPCVNLRVGSSIFNDCLKGAGGGASATANALSCYYSGNYVTGYRQGYVARVLGASPSRAAMGDAIPVIATTPRKARRAATPPVAAPSQSLFVSAPDAPVNTVASSDATPASKGRPTALLF